MPFFVIAWGALFVLFGPSLARHNAARFRRAYGRSIPFPAVWGHFNRAIGVLFILAGVAMLLGIGVKAR